MSESLTPEEAVETIMNAIKMVLPDDSNVGDGKLLFYINKLVDDVLTYCHREDFPKPLVYTCADLIMKRIADDAEAAAGTKGLKSVKMDDTEFQFNTTTAPVAGLQSDLDFASIRPRLNLFRKLRCYP